MARIWRRRAATLLALIAFTGCVDSGLPDKNLPLEQARHREWSYPIYLEAVQPSGLPELVSFNESTWALQAAAWPEYGLESALTRDPTLLRSVATGAAPLQALRWDTAPFDRLFLASPGGLRTYERVY